MENILPYIIQVGELVGAAILGGWVSRVLTIRSRVRQEQAGANKAEAEAKADEIQNIQDIVQKVYEPTILALKKQVEELRDEVREVRAENERLKDDASNAVFPWQTHDPRRSESLLDRQSAVYNW